MGERSRVHHPPRLRRSGGGPSHRKCHSNVSLCGDGLHVAPISRTARLERRADGRLVAASETAVTADDIFDLIDSIRR